MKFTPQSLEKLNYTNATLAKIYGGPILLNEILRKHGYSHQQINRLKNYMLVEFIAYLSGWLSHKENSSTVTTVQDVEAYILQLSHDYIGEPQARTEARFNALSKQNNEDQYINRQIYTNDHGRFLTKEWEKHQVKKQDKRI